jgi:parvulin-like peptidyl-prolyl isomerase
MLVHSVAAQTSRTLTADTLATVGSTVITERELIERLELMPWQGKERRDQHDSMKVKALLSIIAEHLLAARAVEIGLNVDSAHQQRVESLQRMLVRDELYQREVRGKVKVNEEEILQAMRRLSRQVSTVMLLSKTQEDARAVQRKLSSRAPLDSALLASLIPYVVFSDTLRIKMGDLEGALEDAGFALDDAHRVSAPVKNGRTGWVVLYYIGSGTHPDAQRLSLPDRRARALSLLRSRKERERLNAYSGSVLAPKRAEARKEIFDLFSDNVHELIVRDSLRYQRKNGYLLSASLLDSLRQRLATQLDNPFVDISDGEAISLEGVIDALRTEEIIFPSLDKVDFRGRMNGTVKRVVEEEFMTREGLRRDLQHSENVRRDVGVWDRYWLARVMERKLRDSIKVNDDEVMDYLVHHAREAAGTWAVNVREVLLDSLTTALRIVERVQRGESLGDLARQFSRRPSWAERSGESGYFRIPEHPALGFAALSTVPGALGGPVHVPEGYSVFTLLGKRRDQRDSTTLSLDSLRSIARQSVTAGRAQEEINKTIVGLARTMPIAIHHARLSKVDIIPSNMVTRRYLGFGGVMVATPILLPQWEWVKDLPERKDLLP